MALVHTPATPTATPTATPPTTSLSALLCAAEKSGAPIHHTETPKHPGGGGHTRSGGGGMSSLLGRVLESKAPHRTTADNSAGLSDCGLQAHIPQGVGPSILPQGSGVGPRHVLARPASEQVVVETVAVPICCASEASAGKNGEGKEGRTTPTIGGRTTPTIGGRSMPTTDLAKLHRQTRQKEKRLEWLKLHMGGDDLGERHGDDLGGGQDHARIKDDWISIGRC